MTLAEPQGIFVYGTLRSGRGNARVVRPVERIAATLNRGLLYGLPDRGYPVLDLSIDGPAPIRGELLRFDDLAAALRILDRLEGLRGPWRFNLYRRGVVEVATDVGRHHRAWVYHLAEDARLPLDAVPLPRGEWMSESP